MCGIAGWLDLAGGRPDEVEATLRAIAHRGPDASGSWSDERCTLAFRRLAIIDLSERGNQPMADEAGEVHVVFNGEIYNHRDLRAELVARGHQFRGESDTEAVVNGWREWGPALLPRLRGMFALAVWEPQRNRLVLARDRAGKKPLFHRITGTRVAFASELQGLLTDPTIDRVVDPLAIDHYLSWGYVPAPRTGFVGIEKLPPAHSLTITVVGDRLRTELAPYWSLDHHAPAITDVDEAQALVRETVTESVRLRLMSDVPLGAFLSGGIDSSIVVGVMAGLVSGPVRTFSIGFGDAAYDELPHARAVAERWGAVHTEEVVEADALALLPSLVHHYGEPYADSSAIPTWYVSRLAREAVTVALNGDGGDEAFGGYDRYRAMRAGDVVARIPGASAMTSLAAGLLPGNRHPKSRVTALRRFLRSAALSRADRYAAWMSYFSSEDKAAAYTSSFAASVDGGRPSIEWFHSLFDDPTLDAAEAAIAADVVSYLPYDLLVKVDIATMAASLEGRSPFLDHRVLELGARIDTDLKIRGGVGKWILREAFADLLPPDIASRPKMGFAVPMAAWLRGPLRDLVRDATLSSEATGRGILRPEAVRRLVDDHLEGRADHAARLWNLIMLEHWHRELVSGRP